MFALKPIISFDFHFDLISNTLKWNKLDNSNNILLCLQFLEINLTGINF